MEPWFVPIGNKKKYDRCEACKQYSYSVFFLWYPHPSISHFHVRDPLKTCTRCCKRETGIEMYNKIIKEHKVK